MTILMVAYPIISLIGTIMFIIVLVKLFQNRVLVSAKRSGVRVSRRDLRGGGWW